jgi:hypothetical protein
MSNSCHSKPPEGIQTDSVRLSAHLARSSNAQELARSRLGLTRFPVVPVCSELRTLGNYIWPPAPDPKLPLDLSISMTRYHRKMP